MPVVTLTVELTATFLGFSSNWSLMVQLLQKQTEFISVRQPYTLWRMSLALLDLVKSRLGGDITDDLMDPTMSWVLHYFITAGATCYLSTGIDK